MQFVYLHFGHTGQHESLTLTDLHDGGGGGHGGGGQQGSFGSQERFDPDAIPSRRKELKHLQEIISAFCRLIKLCDKTYTVGQLV